jgi:dihydrofolate reductase
MGTYVDQWFRQAGSFLLGRRTYDIFAAHWPLVTDPADTVATGLNTLPKYVASRTMQRADWAGTTVLHDVPGEVAKLKEQPGGEIQVHGSGELIRSLMAHDLVDEYRLWIYPVVLGSGMRLFGDTEDAAALKLVDTKITSTGVAIHVYQPAGKATYGSFALE